MEGHQTDTGAEPLVFRGRLTEEDAVALRHCHDRVLLRRPFRWLARGFAAALGGLMTWFILDKGPSVVAVLTVACCAYVLFVLPFERAWTARLHYRRRADDYLETEARLTTDRVSIVNAAQRTEISLLVEMFRGRVVDISQTNMMMEIAGQESKIEAFIDLMRPFGIVELARTGRIALVRGTSKHEGGS